MDALVLAIKFVDVDALILVITSAKVEASGSSAELLIKFKFNNVIAIAILNFWTQKKIVICRSDQKEERNDSQS